MHPALRSAVQSYASRGWQTSPVEFMGKSPTAAWGAQSNVALVLGAASGHLADVDLDSPEAVALAPNFLPPTLGFGRGGETRHLLYVAEGAPTRRFTDAVDHQTLVELRANSSTGGPVMSVCPPSVHASGQEIAWADGPNEPARVDAAWLEGQVRALAAAVLEAKHGAEMPDAVAQQRAEWLNPGP